MNTPSTQQQQELLMKLIFKSELRQMMQLVPTLPTLNFITPQECTPLTLAVDAAEEEVIEYLLSMGADPNFADTQSLPLLMAIDRSIEGGKNTEDDEDLEDPVAIVELLLRYGADFNKST
jgi:ankyrin repeat protein